MEKQKKGAISIETLITIILVLLGFALVLIFYYSIDWTGTIDRDVCHQSVIFRATAPGLTKAYIPLKCQTAKICITDKFLGKGDCKTEYGDAKGVITMRVNDKEDVEKIYAQEMVECWEMMGEGKVDLFYQGAQLHGFGTIYPSCVICSRIAIDKDLKINLSKMNVEEYMILHKMPNKEISYYQYLAGENAKVNIADNLVIQGFEEEIGGEKVKVENANLEVQDLQKDASLEKKETAILFMQITAPEHGEVIKNSLRGLGIGWGLSFATAPKAVGGATLKLLASPYTWAVIAIAGITQQGFVAYNRAVTAGTCGDVSIGDEARDGCSVVRTINYDVEEIKNYCTNIESID